MYRAGMWVAPLLRLESLLAGGLNEDAALEGLEGSEARLLLVLEPGTGISMQELARRLGRDPTTVTRAADRAERHGLIERRPGSRDRRQRMTLLSETGLRRRLALVERRERRARSLVDAVLGETGLGEGQIAWFLAALVAGLERTAEPPDGLVRGGLDPTSSLE